jgi:chaperonin cofactor prefoldin
MSRPGLDDPMLFMYKGQSQVKRADTSTPYLSVSTTVFSYQGRDPKNEGQFRLSLQAVSGGTQFSIFRPGTKPLVCLNVTKTLNWTLSNKVYANFSDIKGAPWLLQFPDATTAALATAMVACLLAIQNTKEIANFDCSPTVAGRGVGIGDRIQVSYWAFAFSTYPAVIDRPVAFKENHSLILARDKVSTGWVSGLVGMCCGTTRVVYIPQQYTALETGARDPSFPNANLLVVTTLHRAKFRDESHSDASGSESPQADNPSADPHPQSGSQSQSDAEKSATEDGPVEPDEAGRQQKLERIRRIGAVGTAFAVPMVPIKGKPDQSHRPPADTETVARLAIGQAPEALLARLEALERSINARLDLLTGGSEAQRVVSGVTGLAAQARAKQQEIDELKRQIEDERTKAAAPVATGDLDELRRELESLKLSNAALEKQAGETDARIQEVEQALAKCGDAAKARAKALIKRMMDGVFQDTTAMFEDTKQYTGKEVGEQLKVMLRKHSMNCLNEINQKGVF